MLKLIVLYCESNSPSGNPKSSRTEPLPFAKIGQTARTGRQSQPKGGNRTRKTETNDKSKRDTVEHIVEMVFVVDYADYERSQFQLE